MLTYAGKLSARELLEQSEQEYLSDASLVDSCLAYWA
jgi:hypothetical protein